MLVGIATDFCSDWEVCSNEAKILNNLKVMVANHFEREGGKEFALSVICSKDGESYTNGIIFNYMVT